MRMKHSVVLLTLLALQFSWAEWRKTADVGMGNSYMTAMGTGKGKNDDTVRVYGGDWTSSGSVFEYTFRNGEWVRELIGSCNQSVWGIAVGPGRNDDTVRIYASATQLWEFTYRNGTWDPVLVGQVPGNILCRTTLAEGRNDDTLRLYAAWARPNEGAVFEFTYSEDGWRTDTVGVPGTWLSVVIAGAGRNDDTVRIYSSGTEAYVYEFTYSNGEWRTDMVGTMPSGHVQGSAIGAGRNDDTTRLYLGTMDLGGGSYIVEYTSRNGTWESENLPRSSNQCGMVVGNGRGDDTNRLYVGSDSITEYTYASDGWVVDTIPVHTRFNYSLRISKARNDDTLRLFGANVLRHIYEYTHYPLVYVAEPRDRIPRAAWLKLTPNPCHGRVSIEFTVPAPLPVNLEVYSNDGRLVDKREFRASKGCNRMVWDARKRKAGVYFIRVKAGEEEEQSKLILLK